MGLNKVALVTGASRGIGKSVALELARLGYRVALVARSEAALADTVASVREHSDALAIAADLSDERAVVSVAEAVIAKWGRVDVLVNNAGVFEMGTLEATLAELDQLYAINLRAPFLFMQALVPHMKAQKSGYVFNVASISGIEGYAGYGAYASSKFGVVGLSEAMFKELAKDNIKVTAICPSFVDTEMAVEAKAPLDGKLMIQPSDIAKTVSWLLDLSPSATVSKIVVNCTATVE